MMMMTKNCLLLLLCISLVGASVSFVKTKGTTAFVTFVSHSKHVTFTCKAPPSLDSEPKFLRIQKLSNVQLQKFEQKFDSNSKEYRLVLDGIGSSTIARSSTFSEDQVPKGKLGEDFKKLAPGATVEVSSEDGITLKVDIPHFNFKPELSGNYLCEEIHINSITGEYEVYDHGGYSKIISIGYLQQAGLHYSASEGFTCSIEDTVQLVCDVGNHCNRSMVVYPPCSSAATCHGGPHGGKQSYEDQPTWHCETTSNKPESDQLHRLCCLNFRSDGRDIRCNCSGNNTPNTFDCSCVDVVDHDLTVNVTDPDPEQCSTTSTGIIVISTIASCIFVALCFLGGVFYFKDKLFKYFNIHHVTECRIRCDSRAVPQSRPPTSTIEVETGIGHDMDTGVKTQDSDGEDDHDGARSGVLIRKPGRVKRKPATVQDDQETCTALVTSASSSS